MEILIVRRLVIDFGCLAEFVHFEFVFLANFDLSGILVLINVLNLSLVLDDNLRHLVGLGFRLIDRINGLIFFCVNLDGTNRFHIVVAIPVSP